MVKNGNKQTNKISKMTPLRTINSELKTVNAFIELLDKHAFDNRNKNPSRRTERGGWLINFGPNPEYRGAQATAEKMKHDLELLQKTCEPSKLLILRKERYYKKVKTKKDISKTIKAIMKQNSIPIDYLSVQEINEFIARI
jgi:hypothetical protein